MIKTASQQQWSKTDLKLAANMFISRFIVDILYIVMCLWCLSTVTATIANVCLTKK